MSILAQKSFAARLRALRGVTDVVADAVGICTFHAEPFFSGENSDAVFVIFDIGRKAIAVFALRAHGVTFALFIEFHMFFARAFFDFVLFVKLIAAGESGFQQRFLELFHNWRGFYELCSACATFFLSDR